MALHLIKLCVGADSIDDLREWVAERSLRAIAAGLEPHSVHTTRMVPKRVEELLDGGSLYWVIKGQVQARQKLLDIQTFTDGEESHVAILCWGPKSSKRRYSRSVRSKAGAIIRRTMYRAI